MLKNKILEEIKEISTIFLREDYFFNTLSLICIIFNIEKIEV